MKPYKPSNQIDKRGWQWLAVTSGVGGMTLGGVAFATSFFVYLVVIMPVLLGLVGGALLREAVYRGKVRNPLIAGGFALITGAAIYGTMHGADYLVFRQNATQEISRVLKSSDKSSQSKAGITLDMFLQERTGTTGFIGFLRYRSQTGIVVNRSSLRIPASAQITWNYWSLEFLITSAIAFGFAFGAAKKPFCESCHSWYSVKDRLGRVKYPHLPEFLEAIEQEETATASKFLDPLAKVYPPSLEVHLESCASCQNSDGILVLTQGGVNKNGVIKFIPHSTEVIYPEQSIELAQAVRESLEIRGADFSEQNSQNFGGQSQTWQQIASAQKERSTIGEKSHKKLYKGSTYTSPNLSTEQFIALYHQLAENPHIKQAYLVQEIASTLPEIPFYLLGIIRNKHIIESATAQTEWESKFGNELEFFGDFAVVILNGDRKLQKKFQEIENSAIYTYTPPIKTPQPALPSESWVNPLWCVNKNLTLQ